MSYIKPKLPILVDKGKNNKHTKSSLDCQGQEEGHDATITEIL